MFNVGAGELLVILVLALVVLGPNKLPGAARSFGRVLGKLRRLVSSFQQEMQAAADAPVEALARARGSLSADPRSGSRPRAEERTADSAPGDAAPGASERVSNHPSPGETAREGETATEAKPAKPAEGTEPAGGEARPE